MKVTLFSQLLQALPRAPFQRLVQQHESDKHSKGICSWTHLVSMVFCHFGHAASLRDISIGLLSLRGNGSHLGIDKAPCKSSVAYINANRDWELFRDYYHELLEHFRQEVGFNRTRLRRIKRKVFIMDSSTVSLSLSLFDWATFRKRKGGLKLHTVLDYDGCLPVFCHVTPASRHDSKVGRMVDFPEGSVVLCDRAYLDFRWMADLDSRKVAFVTRSKENMAYRTVKVLSRGTRRDGVLKDSIVALTGPKSSKDYPENLRLVRFWDEVSHRELEFLTNNMSWTAQTIADLYKERWNIEAFFKNIKQRLHIKSFVGTSMNAVMIQIWTALICYLTLAFLKEKAAHKWSLSNLVTFLRLNLFAKVDLWEWINNPFNNPRQMTEHQLSLFETG